MLEVPGCSVRASPRPGSGRRRGHGPRLLVSRRVYGHRLHSLRPSDRTSATRPGERHTYPGLGKYPTSAWVPGYAFCDTYVVPVETWAPAPIRYRIELGLYNATTGDRPMAYTVDGLPFDPPIVGSLNVGPAGHLDTEPQHPLIVDFGDAIRMVGYDLREAGTTSSTVSVTLHWEATGEPLQDYVAFVHLWSPGDPAPLAQHDSQPREGWYPTSGWKRR